MGTVAATSPLADLFANASLQAPVVRQLPARALFRCRGVSREWRVLCDQELARRVVELHAMRGNDPVSAVRALEAVGAYVVDNRANDGHGGSGSTAALRFVACTGYASAVRLLLLEVGAVDVRGKHNMDGRTTALHLAAETGRVRVLQALAHLGADVGATLVGGRTALHLASAGGRAEVVSVLLAMGADVRAPLRDRRTALHLAADGGHARAVRLLLAMGADARATAVYGITPLHSAAKFSCLEVVKALVAAGADPTARTDWGMTPIGVARFACNKHLEWALKRRLTSATVRPPPHTPCECRACMPPAVRRLAAERFLAEAVPPAPARAGPRGLSKLFRKATWRKWSGRLGRKVRSF